MASYRRFTLILFLASSSGAAAQPLPAGYVIDKSAAFTPTGEWRSGTFEISIARQAADSTELAMILAAETLYPTRELIDSVVSAWADSLRRNPDPYVPPENRIGLRLAGIERLDSIRSDSRWWHWAKDSDPVPYSITRSAIHHYAEKVRELAESPGVDSLVVEDVETGEESTIWRRERSASLRYSAQVVRVSSDEPDGVAFRVSMEFEFANPSGVLGGGAVWAERSVLFDSTGRAIRILGDGSGSFTWH